MRLWLALVLVCLDDAVVAWGPLFEPLKGGGRGAHALLASRNSHNNESSDKGKSKGQKQRRKRQSMYQEDEETLVSFYYHDADLYEILWNPARGTINDDPSQSLLPLWNSWDQFFTDDYDIECHGDECEEECVIPDEYKVLPDHEQAVDVLAYLGIQRAEPLRVRDGYDSTWE